MAYATYEDIQRRNGVKETDSDYVKALLDDAAVIIDAYNDKA